MIWVQFKDPISYMCLAGATVASWSLTQEVTGSSPFNDNFLSLNSAFFSLYLGILVSLTVLHTVKQRISGNGNVRISRNMF